MIQRTSKSNVIAGTEVYATNDHGPGLNSLSRVPSFQWSGGDMGNLGRSQGKHSGIDLP